MKFVDYLLMRSPGPNEIDSPGRISTRRIILSLAGLILGIFFSFLITGITGTPTTTQTSHSETSTSQSAVQPTTGKSDNVRISFPNAKELLSLGLITFVICMITYQGLYSSLKLYENEPAFLVVFVSFQYGFFWQSLVRGGAALLT
jgi:ABC-type antimicrobial peptide transport system permease subunit